MLKILFEWINLHKTTFIHFLYRIRQDFTGSIRLNDALLSSIKENKIAALRQNKLSVIFQDLKLFTELSARENVEIKRLLVPNFCTAEKVLVMAESLGILHIMEQKARLCSFGEQQRIAIIRALVQPFDWLVTVTQY